MLIRKLQGQIAKSWFSGCWHWTIGGLVGALSVGVSEGVLAQIVPEHTLGEGSIVTPNVDIRGIASDQLDGGAIRGANLFHSFQEFNVGAGRGAYFTNLTGIENILSRLGAQSGGQILVRTTEVVLSESSSLTAIVTRTGKGTGGDLTIDTGRLLVSDGADISSRSRGEGTAGDINITVRDTLQIVEPQGVYRLPNGKLVLSRECS